PDDGKSATLGQRWGALRTRDPMQDKSLPASPGQIVRRWMYGERFVDFVNHSASELLGQLLQGSAGSVEPTQRSAWVEQIDSLKTLQIPDAQRSSAKIYFEYSIPRLGRRADVILIVGQVLFVLEFKVGESRFNPDALDQVWDYALDLKNFHESSHNL